MDETVFQTLEKKLSSFSKGKQQIATYILENLDDAAFQTAAQIGKAVKISESTVVRFASELGYRGFPDFQKALQQELKAHLQSSTSAVSLRSQREGDTPSSDIEHYGGNSHYLFPNNDDPIMHSFVETLDRGRALYLIGSTLGELLLPYCEYAAQTVFHHVFLSNLGSKESLIRELSSIQSGNVVLALCIGDVPSIVRFFTEQAKLQGADVLWITDQSSIHINRLADPVLEVSAQAQKNLPDLSQFTALIHRIFTLLICKRENVYQDRKQRIEDIKYAYDKYEST